MFHIKLDRKSPQTLVNQVYEQLRALILGGILQTGEKLPSTRELAAFLDVSRNVVTTAYELLNAEGFLEGKHGSGSYVAQGVFWEDGAGNRAEEVSRPAAAVPAGPADAVDFRSGIPALDRVPRKLLARFTNESWYEAADHALGYGSPAGSPELREEVAAYLHKTRGVVCRPEQIMITSGAVQGLALIAKALVREGDSVWVEDPSNRDIARIFQEQGARTVPVPVDEQGIRTAALPCGSKPVLTVVTPSHQFPLGGILPIQRRIDLIRMARDTESLIVEDDYDSEFRYEGPPVSSLQGLEPQRVIYLGTFSKILLPALRLGYMVLPPAWMARFADFKRLDDIHSNTLSQLALAGFIRAGHLARHTAQLKKVYRKKRDVLIAALQRAFPGRVRIYGASTGLHLVAQWEGIRFDGDLIRRLGEGGVIVYPVEAHAMVKERHADKIILGFGHLSQADIAAGVDRMKAVFDK